MGQVPMEQVVKEATVTISLTAANRITSILENAESIAAYLIEVEHTTGIADSDELAGYAKEIGVEILSRNPECQSNTEQLRALCKAARERTFTRLTQELADPPVRKVDVEDET